MAAQNKKSRKGFSFLSRTAIIFVLFFIFHTHKIEAKPPNIDFGEEHPDVEPSDTENDFADLNHENPDVEPSDTGETDPDVLPVDWTGPPDPPYAAFKPAASPPSAFKPPASPSKPAAVPPSMIVESIPVPVKAPRPPSPPPPLAPTPPSVPAPSIVGPPKTSCGNGVLDAGEVCDGTNVGYHTCESRLGFGTRGVLLCKANCAAFDTSQCTTKDSTGCTGLRRVFGVFGFGLSGKACCKAWPLRGGCTTPPPSSEPPSDDAFAPAYMNVPAPPAAPTPPPTPPIVPPAVPSDDSWTDFMDKVAFPGLPDKPAVDGVDGGEGEAEEPDVLNDIF